MPCLSPNSGLPLQAGMFEDPRGMADCRESPTPSQNWLPVAPVVGGIQ
jgi:hypothetical protein